MPHLHIVDTSSNQIIRECTLIPLMYTFFFHTYTTSGFSIDNCFWLGTEKETETDKNITPAGARVS